MNDSRLILVFYVASRIPRNQQIILEKLMETSGREGAAIEVDSLVKRYGDFTAVDDITFSVNPREIFAFLGPNGAGKTTTIKILTTLLERTSGQVRVNGYDPGKSPADARRSFGIVFQDQSLDDELTAQENMEYHGVLYGVEKKLRRQRIKELLNYVELWERKDKLVKTFSGGMKRRLEIARGLIHHPKVLFLDEPTLGLDPQTRNYIWEYINKLTREEDMTVLFTTHYMDEAQRNANRIAIIDHGKIVVVDTPQDMMRNTDTDNIEAAFLSYTGHEIREMEADSIDRMRMMRKA